MTDRPDSSAGPRAVTVHGPGGPADLVLPGTATVAEVARACAERWTLPTLPLLYTRTGEALPVAAGVAALEIETGAVLVAVTAVVRHAPARDARDNLSHEGGGRRRGRRRRDVVSTRDGAGPRHALRGCRDGG